MQVIRKNGHWIVAVAGIVSLAYSAGLMHVKVPTLAVLEARDTRDTKVAEEPPEDVHAFGGRRGVVASRGPCAKTLIDGRAQFQRAPHGAAGDPLIWRHGNLRGRPHGPAKRLPPGRGAPRHRPREAWPR